MKGFVIKMGDRSGDLKEILGVSGEVPVFNEPLLKSLQWASHHYVAPFSVLLEKAAPPTLPKRTEHVVDSEDLPEMSSHHPLASLAGASSRGNTRPSLAYIVNWTDPTWIDSLIPVVAVGRSAMVVVATAREVERIGDLVASRLPKNTVVLPDANDSSVTRVWEKAQSAGVVVVGTPRIASWKMPQLGLAVIVEEGRRAMKDRQTPTVHVRDMLQTRSRVEGFGLLFVGQTPSVEVVAFGAELIQPKRPWGLVEVVDRRDDPPGSGFVSERTVAALRSSAESGEESFVFTHIRAADASARCTTCRSLRRCARCGSHIGQREDCSRCGQVGGACPACGGVTFESMGSVPGRIVAELKKRVGRDLVGLVGEQRPVAVGTERDLSGVGGIHLGVAVDVDALNYGTNYRSGEEALRILGRLVGSVARGQGYRTILQTSKPDSDLVRALRRAEPIPYLEGVLARRARDGFPPAAELLAFETRSAEPDEVTNILSDLAPGMVLGPMPTNDGHRWLLQGDLGAVKTNLRKVVQRLRDSGATVRVDADPIDL